MENLAPWFVVLVVFIGMAVLQWRVVNALDQALARTSPVLTPPVIIPTTPPPYVPPPVTPPVIVPTAPVVIASGPFANAPIWFQNALHEIGFHETGNNQGIGRYIDLAHAGSEGDPWCAIFCNAMLEKSGVPGTRSASSQSFRTNSNFVQLSLPAIGAIAVFWRGSQASGLGHAGFYRGESADHVWTLGGNENDMVQIESLPKQTSGFGLVGYWWPKSVPLPTSGPVQMPAGSPISVEVDPTTGAPAVVVPSAANGVQTNIVATVFGGQQSAYGGPIIDNQPGVALPYRFTGTRPQVKVTGKSSGLSVVCDIVDVGPWNINDPYWKTGARPQAESGTDLGQTVRGVRPTNKAGIDLTIAAAAAIKIDGKGLCSWQFVETPTVT